MLIFQGVNITHFKRRSHHLPSTFIFLGPTCEFLPGVQLCRLCFDLYANGFGHPFKIVQLWNATFQQHKILSPKCLVICFHHNTSGLPGSFFSKFTVFFRSRFVILVLKKKPQTLETQISNLWNLPKMMRLRSWTPIFVGKKTVYIFPGIPTTIKTMGVNITTIEYEKSVLIIEIGEKHIILMMVEAQGFC